MNKAPPPRYPPPRPRVRMDWTEPTAEMLMVVDRASRLAATELQRAGLPRDALQWLWAVQVVGVANAYKTSDATVLGDLSDRCARIRAMIATVLST